MDSSLFKLIPFFLLLSGCHWFKPADRNQENNLMIKTYTVPVELGENLATGLNKVLESQPVVEHLKSEKNEWVDKVVHVEAGLGRAQLTGTGGAILVSAPASIHAGIPEYLEKAVAASRSASSKIQIRIWTYASVKSKAKSPLSEETKALVGQILKPADDDCVFLLEELMASTSAGNQLDINGRETSISANVADLADSFLAELRLHRGPNFVQTEANLSRGGIELIGQTDFNPQNGNKRTECDMDKTQNGKLYFVVQVSNKKPPK